MIATDLHSTSPHALHRIEPGEAGDDTEELVTITSRGIVVHDSSILVAALEQLEAQRRALEWLLDNELLWRCL